MSQPQKPVTTASSSRQSLSRQRRRPSQTSLQPVPSSGGPSSPLCFFSEAFDPTAALAAPVEEVERLLPTRRDVAIFRKTAPLDNVHACASLATAPFLALVHKPLVATTSASSTTGAAASRRRNTQDSMIKSVVSKNVLRTMLRKFGANGGPLAFLLRSFELRSHVCVVMRRSMGLRGRVVGVLSAFDRHLNVVLSNATIYDAADDRVDAVSEDDDVKVDEDLFATQPHTSAPTARGPPVPRFVKQLFVRGDNVVAICRG
jgi:small nuclear ribonucleoprotein (snRNP)-like protein